MHARGGDDARRCRWRRHRSAAPGERRPCVGGRRCRAAVRVACSAAGSPSATVRMLDRSRGPRGLRTVAPKRAQLLRQVVGDRADALLDRRRPDLEQQLDRGAERAHTEMHLGARFELRRVGAQLEVVGEIGVGSRRRSSNRAAPGRRARARARRRTESRTPLAPAATCGRRPPCNRCRRRGRRRRCAPTAWMPSTTKRMSRSRQKAPSAARSVRKPDCQSTALTATTRVRASTAAAISSTPKRTRGRAASRVSTPSRAQTPPGIDVGRILVGHARRRCRPRATAGRRRSATSPAAVFWTKAISSGTRADQPRAAARADRHTRRPAGVDRGRRSVRPRRRRRGSRPPPAAAAAPGRRGSCARGRRWRETPAASACQSIVVTVTLPLYPRRARPSGPAARPSSSATPTAPDSTASSPITAARARAGARRRSSPRAPCGSTAGRRARVSCCNAATWSRSIRRR